MTAVPLPSHCRPGWDDSHDRLPSQHPSVGRQSAVVPIETAEHSPKTGTAVAVRSRVLNPTPPQWIRAVEVDRFATSLAASIRPADLRSVFRTEAHGP